MDPKLDLDPSPPPRRPRGFAAAVEEGAAAAAAGKGRKEREREKERTKLRERHRRAITSRMLAGLRQHGSFPLPARADMNDVVAALAREAGWVVEPDGTTYRPSNPAPRPPAASQLASFRSVESPSVSSLKNQNHSTRTVLDCEPSILGLDDSLSPGSFDSIVVVEGDMKDTQFVNASPINSSECMEANQLMHDIQRTQDADFSGTPYVPFFVMLPISIINGFCQLVDPESVREILHHLKSMHIDGVAVSCWWGIVENWSPQKYVWSGYRALFNIIREFKIKLQVVMAFHEGGSGSCEIPITLPKWVMEIGRDNQDIFFTDREGRRNTECLSWGIDKERVLKGRTGMEVYFDFMRSFRMEFDDLFAEGLISAVEIGLGASGELKYPSFSENVGWKYPGIGEFQCYDKYLQQNLRRAAKLRGHSFWARGPDNAGHYNSRPHETGFFCDRGDYDSYYGHFFLQWYAQTLINHADNVLSLANLVFEGTQMVVKIPAVFWWYRTASHPAELTAGFYNPTNRDGYIPVFDMLHRHSVTVKITCSGSRSSVPENEEALADPDGLTWQLLNSAWDRGLLLAGQNAFFCLDRESCIKFLETAKPRDDPDRRHFSFFTFQLSSLTSILEIRSPDLHYLVKCMHGESICPQ